MKTVLRCGRLITGVQDEVLENAEIVIVDGKISSVSAGSGSPATGNEGAGACAGACACACADVEVHDFGAFTVMPGVIDGHDHLGLDMGDEEAQAREHLCYTAIKGVKNAEHLLRSGITTMRVAGEREFLDKIWRGAINEGLMLGPRLIICGQPICRTGGHGWYLGIEADGVDAVRKAVRTQIKAGVDQVKFIITGGMSTTGSNPLASEYTKEEIVAAIREAHRANRRITGHAHGGDGLKWAVEAGLDSIEHGMLLTEDEIKMIADKGCFLVVNTGVTKAAVKAPNIPYSDRLKGIAENYVENLRIARRYNVKLAIGGDTYHGHVADELSTFVEAGFSHLEAIRIATVNGAELCGLSDVTGSIQAGKLADIIVIDGNPLDNIEDMRNVAAVMKEGQMIRN